MRYDQRVLVLASFFLSLHMKTSMILASGSSSNPWAAIQSAMIAVLARPPAYSISVAWGSTATSQIIRRSPRIATAASARAICCASCSKRRWGDVGRIDRLRDDAFKPELTGVRKDDFANAGIVAR
jgi:hypothetical protein